MSIGNEPTSKIEDKIPEYSFEAGVRVAIERILELREKLNRDFYVVINGSNVDVGKSALLAKLQLGIKENGIETEHMLDVGIGGGKKVIFLTKQGLVQKKGENYKDHLLEIDSSAPGKNSSYGDLYIGIYRTDKNFQDLIPVARVSELEPVADIMICNEFAKDKPKTFRE